MIFRSCTDRIRDASIHYEVTEHKQQHARQRHASQEQAVRERAGQKRVKLT